MPSPSNEAGQPNTQDVMFMSAPLEYQHNESFIPDSNLEGEGVLWPPNANVSTHELMETRVIVGSVAPALAIMTRAMRGNRKLERETVVQEECSSKDPPH